MKHNSFFAVAVVAIAILSGCEKLTGTANILANSQVNKTASGSRTVVLAAGNYNATISFGSSTSQITLQGAGGNQSFRIKTPAGLKDNPNLGSFRYSAADLGQTFSLVGSSKVQSKRGNTYSTTESCELGSHTESYEWCPEPPPPPDFPPPGFPPPPGTPPPPPPRPPFPPPRCETRYREVTDYGSRPVTGYNVTSQQQIVAEMRSSNNNKIGTLTFMGKTSTSFTETSSGSCR